MKNKFDAIRTQFMGAVRAMFEASKYDVLRTGSQEFAIPIVDEDGEEGYIVITFKIPKGSRDGTAYDGYELAEEYKRKVAETAEKKAKALEEKKRKIERDKKYREKKGS